jgi:outer membrane protein TolC
VFPRLVLASSCLALLAGCRSRDVPPLDAPDPAPVLAKAAGVAASVEFRTEGEPDDAGAPAADLPLDAALREALVHDPRLQQALARWHAARAGSEETRLSSNPLLSVGLLFAETVSDWSVNVSITQEIAAYLQRPHRAGAADARLRAAAEEALAAAQDAVAEARSAYLAAQDADARRPAMTKHLDALTRLRDLHVESVREGEGVPGDVTALDAERVAAELDLAELDAERAKARIELARLVGRPSDPGEWTLSPWPSLPAPAGDARPWIDGALARRAEIRAIGWELAALGEERALVETWPWDGAGGIEMEYDEGFKAGPVLEVPLRLFDASAPRTAAIAAAETELRHRAVEVRRSVIRDVRVALADEAAARRALELLEKGLLPLLERRREQIDVAKRAGEVEMTLLLLADRELETARARRVELEHRVLDA